MTIYTFLRQCNELWPGKELTLKQEEFYHVKMSRFSEKEISKIFDELVETSKYFPKIADIYDAARECGFMDRHQEYRPHEWTPNDCRLCGGSGQLAVFFEQLFDLENGHRSLTLKRVMQYESSNPTARTTDWIRYFFVCSCPRGAVETLDKGWPVWTGEMPSTLKIALEAKQ